MKALSQADAGWQAYSQFRSPELREKLLLQYMPLVRRSACRMIGSMPRSVRFDDLVSAGVMGLISSIDSFDPTLGIKFETYAINRIRGSMVDSLRELDWVPRSVRQKVRQLERTMEGLAQRLGHWPEDADVAHELHVPLQDYHQMLEDVNVSVLLSLDDAIHSLENDNGTLGDVAPDTQSVSSDELVEDQELHDVLVETLRTLPDQEKLVLALYYYEELTLKEIGAVLNLTESRVSQIHSKAILKLRSDLRRNLNR